MEGPLRDVVALRAAEAELDNLDRRHPPNRIVLACTRHLDIFDLLALYDCVSGMEKRLLETWGPAAIHTLYHQLLQVAFLAGTKNPSPLEKRESTPEHVVTCLIDVLLNAVAGEVSTLYYEGSGGFPQEQSVALRVSGHVEPFVLRFDLNGAGAFTRLRWSPLRQSACRVRIKRILYVDGRRSYESDGRNLAHNGRNVGNGLIQFLTLEPMFTLDAVSGPGGTLTIEGEWEKIEPHEFIASVTQTYSQRTVQRVRRGIAYFRMHGARAFVRKVGNKLAVSHGAPV
jgi:hypothetical protein